MALAGAAQQAVPGLGGDPRGQERCGEWGVVAGWRRPACRAACLLLPAPPAAESQATPRPPAAPEAARGAGGVGGQRRRRRPQPWRHQAWAGAAAVSHAAACPPACLPLPFPLLPTLRAAQGRPLKGVVAGLPAGALHPTHQPSRPLTRVLPSPCSSPPACSVKVKLPAYWWREEDTRSALRAVHVLGWVQRKGMAQAELLQSALTDPR